MGSPTKTIQYRYDSRGNRSALIDHDGGRFTYSYDTVNRITQVQNPQGDRTSYSYDAGGRRTVKRLANGTRASFTYDAAGNLSKLSNLKSTGSVISSFDYQYDKVGNRTAVLEAGGSRVTWSYDNAYQLTGEHRTGTNPYRQTFTYDPAGNRLLKNHDGARTTSVYDAANQLTHSEDAGGRTTFTFDADGNQQVVQAPTGDRTTYAWDYENRMTQALLPTGIRNTMAYDADGLRVKLEESTATKKFVWDDQNHLGETDAANDTQVIYTNEPLVYGNLVSQRRGSTTHWYQFDALGSTRDLTDWSATVTDTRLYDAWGHSIASSGSTVSPFRWVGDVGYYYDSELGSCYVRERIYAPSGANWLSRDVLWPLYESYAYAYAANNPLFFVDPTGLACIVCAEVIHLHKVPIDPLDDSVLGKPHRELADGVVRNVNRDLAARGLRYPIPLAETGLHFVRTRTTRDAALFFLFFVKWYICESASPAGECRLFLDETGSETTWTEMDGAVTIHVGRDFGDITDRANGPVRKVPLLKPIGECNKLLIFVDFAGGSFTFGQEGFKKKVRQHFEVRDSGTGKVVWTTKNKIDFSVDLAGQASPIPDFVHIS